jgi:hypothetical protein
VPAARPRKETRIRFGDHEVQGYGSSARWTGEEGAS